MSQWIYNRTKIEAIDAGVIVDQPIPTVQPTNIDDDFCTNNIPIGESSFGAIESKSFPRFNANKHECSWLFAADKDKRLTIVIDVFTVRPGNDATLSIQKGNGQVVLWLDDSITEPQRLTIDSGIRKWT